MNKRSSKNRPIKRNRRFGFGTGVLVITAVLTAVIATASNSRSHAPPTVSSRTERVNKLNRWIDALKRVSVGAPDQKFLALYQAHAIPSEVIQGVPYALTARVVAPGDFFVTVMTDREQATLPADWWGDQTSRNRRPACFIHWKRTLILSDWNLSPKLAGLVFTHELVHAWQWRVNPKTIYDRQTDDDNDDLNEVDAYDVELALLNTRTRGALWNTIDRHLRSGTTESLQAAIQSVKIDLPESASATERAVWRNLTSLGWLFRPVDLGIGIDRKENPRKIKAARYRAYVASLIPRPMSAR